MALTLGDIEALFAAKGDRPAVKLVWFDGKHRMPQSVPQRRLRPRGYAPGPPRRQCDGCQ